jgi:hypothetical protein
MEIPLKDKYVDRKETKRTQYTVRTGNRRGNSPREARREARDQRLRRRREHVRATVPR